MPPPKQIEYLRRVVGPKRRLESEKIRLHRRKWDSEALCEYLKRGGPANLVAEQVPGLKEGDQPHPSRTSQDARQLGCERDKVVKKSGSKVSLTVA